MDSDTINYAFTICVMIATCFSIFTSSSICKQTKVAGVSKFLDLEESLRKMIEQAEDAQLRLSNQLRIEKNELNQLLTVIQEAKESQFEKNLSIGESGRKNTENKNYATDTEDLPNESWLTAPAILNNKRKQTKSALKISQVEEPLYSMVQEREDEVHISQESLALGHKRFKKRASEHYINNSTASEGHSNDPLSSVAYNIARRLLRDGKSPEVIAKKLDLQVNEVLMLASLEEETVGQAKPKQYSFVSR